MLSKELAGTERILGKCLKVCWPVHKSYGSLGKAHYLTQANNASASLMYVGSMYLIVSGRPKDLKRAVMVSFSHGPTSARILLPPVCTHWGISTLYC